MQREIKSFSQGPVAKQFQNLDSHVSEPRQALSLAHCSFGVGCGQMIRRARKNMDGFQFRILMIPRKILGRICSFIWLSELALPLIFQLTPALLPLLQNEEPEIVKNQASGSESKCVNITHQVLHGAALVNFPKMTLMCIPGLIQVLPFTNKENRAQKGEMTYRRSHSQLAADLDLDSHSVI